MDWKKRRLNCNSVKDVVNENAKELGYSSIEEFVKDEKEKSLNLKSVVSAIYDAIKKKENIMVVGDYDVDGLMASCIMYLFISSIGGNVKIRIPRRLTEGYGLNEKIIDEIDSGLLITVDNGIKAHAAIKKAKEKGLKVILTDHHMPDYDDKGNEIIPEADIVVDPHLKSVNLGNDVFEDYCGAAIAYKIAENYLGKDNELSKKLYTYASIATIADVVPLYGENRLIVKRGLNLLNKGTGTTGLRKLLNSLWLNDHIQEDNIGFDIGPMLNAPGRLEDTGGLKVMELLGIDKDRIRENQLIDQIKELNKKRKDLVLGHTCLAQKEVGLNPKSPIVVQTTAPEGILGILAAKLKEEYQMPTLVFTKTENGLKGSGRSTDKVNLYELLYSHKDMFSKLGGHAKAAGFTIPEENFDELKAALQKDLEDSEKESQYYDLEIDVSEIEDVYNQEKAYRPFGEANPNPTVLIRNVSTDGLSEIKAQHIKIQAKDKVCIMGYYMLDKYNELLKPAHIDLIGTIGSSWFKDEETINVTITDFKKSENENEILNLEECLIKEGMI